MPFFAYKARNTQGALVEGVLEDIDSNGVANQLSANGVIPIEIVPTKKTVKHESNHQGWWEKFSAEKVRSIDVQLFSRQIHTLLKAGVPIMRGLAGLQESAINKSFARILQDIRESLESGRELSASMYRHPTVFSHFYLSMVRVGEMTGQMDEIFLRLFDHLEFEREMRERIRTALRYPMFVIIAMAVAMLVINLFVIPAFAKVYAGFNAELPLMTKILINTSDFTVKFWPLILVFIAGAVIAFRSYIATANGAFRWDKLKMRIPIVGKIILKGTMARFARSFALASRSGVPIVQALKVVAKTVDNRFIESRVDQIREGVERGESILRTSIATGVFTPVVLQMIAVGEETGEMDNLMEEIASMYEREVDYELKTLSSQIEPILIVGLGILVLILALGVFLPIWDLGKAAMHK